MLRRFVGSLVALVAIDVLAQVRLPDRWVTDYDYEENLSVYLMRQYDAAGNRKLGLRASIRRHSHRRTGLRLVTERKGQAAGLDLGGADDHSD